MGQTRQGALMAAMTALGKIAHDLGTVQEMRQTAREAIAKMAATDDDEVTAATAATTQLAKLTAITPGAKRAVALFTEAFSAVRDPRSEEYKAGTLAALMFRCTGAKIQLPYPVGTAAADAFFAGADEGHRRFPEDEESKNRH